MIEVGELIRTKDGFIAKLEDVEDIDEDMHGNKRISLWAEDFGGCYQEPHIIEKHSFNIIDLIEVRRLCKWRRNRFYKYI